MLNLDLMNNQDKFDTLQAFTDLSFNLRKEIEAIYGVFIYFDPWDSKYKYTKSDTISLLCESFCISMNMLIVPSNIGGKYNGETVKRAVFTSLLFAVSLNLHKCYALFASGSTDKDDNLECFDISMDAIYLGQFIKLLLSNKILK